jgi:glycosyltransferase involved in cell wall biosynthesis
MPEESYYLELVGWTGRAILENKSGQIPANQPPILQRLQIDPEHWIYMTQHFESKFKLPEDTLVMATVAQLISPKGHRYLLQAMPRLIKRIPNISWLVIGKGPL